MESLVTIQRAQCHPMTAAELTTPIPLAAYKPASRSISVQLRRPTTTAALLNADCYQHRDVLPLAAQTPLQPQAIQKSIGEVAHQRLLTPLLDLLVDLLVQVAHRRSRHPRALQHLRDVFDPAHAHPGQIHLDQRLLHRRPHHLVQMCPCPALVDLNHCTQRCVPLPVVTPASTVGSIASPSEVSLLLLAPTASDKTQIKCAKYRTLSVQVLLPPSTHHRGNTTPCTHGQDRTLTR